MQNSPLLVTKTSPITAVNASLNKEPSKQPNDAFESVLSKRVKQQETQAQTVSKKTNSVNHEGKQNKASTSVDDGHVEALLTSLTEHEAAKDASLATEVDAQTLAAEATTKVLQDVTDGKVAITVEATSKTLSDVTSGNVITAPQQDAHALQASLTNVMVSTQRAVQPITTDAINTAEGGALEQLKQPLTEVGKEVMADEKAELVEMRLQDKAMHANPLKEATEKLNPKFANALAIESKQVAPVDASIEANSKVTSDIAAVPLQVTAAKSSAMPTTPLQVGVSNLINTPPGKAGWNEAIGQKVVWMVGAAEQSATLTLNPKDLGPLQVIIHVNNEKADATFISENPEVRKALEEGMSSLRNAMGQAGIELGQANVNTGKQQQEFQQANKAYATRKNNQNNEEVGAEQLMNSTVIGRLNNGLVDTFV